MCGSQWLWHAHCQGGAVVMKFCSFHGYKILMYMWKINLTYKQLSMNKDKLSLLLLSMCWWRLTWMKPAHEQALCDFHWDLFLGWSVWIGWHTTFGTTMKAICKSLGYWLPGWPDYWFTNLLLVSKLNIAQHPAQMTGCGSSRNPERPWLSAVAHLPKQPESSLKIS